MARHLLSSSVFSSGVASGDPLADRVVLWTRVTVGDALPLPVEWSIAHDPGLTDVVARGEVMARAEHDHAVHVDPSGLVPATTYFYGFEARGVRSPVGRTRTLPAGQVDQLRLAVTSCTQIDDGCAAGYTRIADRGDRDEVDFVLHLGDAGHDGSGSVTLDEHRARYRRYVQAAPVQRLRSTVALIATTVDPSDASFQAREEWLPIRRPDPADPTRIHRTVPAGDLADLLISDDRSGQHGWLADELSASTAAWRLWAPASASAVATSPPAPDAVLAHLETHSIADVVMLSRDRQAALATEVRRDRSDGSAEPLAVHLGPAVIDGAAALHGYLLLDLDHDRVRGEWWFTNDSPDRSAGERCAAVYEVERGLARPLSTPVPE